MATVLDVVTRAHRIIGVVDHDVPLQAHHTETGLTALNDMLSGWKARDVDVSHTDYASASATFETSTLTADYRDATTWLLAAHLAPEYAVPLSPEAAQMADRAWRTITGDFLTVTTQTVDLGLQQMPSSRWGPTRVRF